MIETVPSKKELRKAVNRKYQDKLKKLPQEEQDALKLKNKKCQECAVCSRISHLLYPAERSDYLSKSNAVCGESPCISFKLSWELHEPSYLSLPPTVGNCCMHSLVTWSTISKYIFWHLILVFYSLRDAARWTGLVSGHIYIYLVEFGR